MRLFILFFTIPITDTTRSKRILNSRSSFALHINNEKRVVHTRRNDKYTIIRTSFCPLFCPLSRVFSTVIVSEKIKHSHIHYGRKFPRTLLSATVSRTLYDTRVQFPHEWTEPETSILPDPRRRH